MVVTAILAGCGGGGSGGTPDPVTPQPPTPSTIRFSTSNAGPAAATTLALVGNVGSAADIVLAVADAFYFERLAALTFECERGGSRQTATARWQDLDRDGHVSEGDTIRFDARACDAAPDLTLEVRGYTADQFGLREARGDLTFSFSIEADSGPATDIDGSLTLDYTSPESRTVIDLDDVEIDQTSGQVEHGLTGASMQVVVDHALQEVALDFSGTADDSNFGGSFGFDTTVEFLRDAAVFPTTGELVLRSGGSKVRLATRGTGIHRESVLLALDADGDGSYSNEEEFRWEDLLPSARTFLDFFTVPRGLYIHPYAPTTDTLRLVALDQIGDTERGQGLPHFQFFRNGEWVGDTNLVYLQAPNKGDVWEARVSFGNGGERFWSASARIWNRPPDLAASLVPAQPDGGDDITVSTQVTDGDHDPVSVSFEWLVNDEAVQDENGATLSAARFARDDVVSVAVLADDGEETVISRLTATIADAEPRVAVQNPPDVVRYGDRVEFGVSFVDPDGDPVPSAEFELDFGPPGMAVDPATGTVTWNAEDLPMFDRSMDVSWQVGSPDDAIAPVSGTLRLVDEARQYPVFRTGPAPSGIGKLSVVDLDGDGSSEMLVLGEHGPTVFEWDGDNYAQSWAYPFALHDLGQSSGDLSGDYHAMAHADIDGDGSHEIFVAAGGTLSRLDGRERRLAVSVGLRDNLPCTDLEMADVDRDGSAELICIARSYREEGSGVASRVVAYSLTDLELLWETPVALHGGSVAVGNVDADPALEIVTSGGYVYDGSSRTVEWRHDVAFGGDIHVGDLDGDGVDEIVGRNKVYSAVQGVELWELPENPHNALLAVGDVIGDDGKAEVIFWPNYYLSVKVYRHDVESDDLVLVNEVHSVPRGSSGRGIAIGDADDDGRPEVVMLKGYFAVLGLDPDAELERIGRDEGRFEEYMGGQLELIHDPDTTPELLFATVNRDFPGPRTPVRAVRLAVETGVVAPGAQFATISPSLAGVVAIDYDRDDLIELVAAVSNTEELLLEAYDPSNEQWSLLTKRPQYQLRGLTRPASADVNGDGHPDVLLAERRGNPRVFAFDAFNRDLLLEAHVVEDRRSVDAVAGADLDQDGHDEIILLTDSREGSPTDLIVVFSRGADDAEFTRTTHPSGTWDIWDVLADDFDDDGKPEVLLFRDSEIHRLDAEFQRIGGLPLHTDSDGCDEPSAFCGFQRYQWGVNRGFVYKPDSGPPQLLVAGWSLLGHGETVSKIIAYHVPTGANIWESPPLLGRINDIHAVQINGRAALSLATSRGMYVTR